MNLGEEVEIDHAGRVCGVETGRVIAKFSHVQEAESFVSLYNSLPEDVIGGFEISKWATAVLDVSTFNAGDRVVITKAEEPYFEVGDKATLVELEDGTWLAAFDNREWEPDDNTFYIGGGHSEFELLAEGSEEKGYNEQ